MRRRSKRAAVLGCGPAGMFAAHAFATSSWDVDIFSKKRQSEMFGAQYLHREIPGLARKTTVVRYDLRGTAEEYRAKVYGDMAVPKVSPEVLPPYHTAWDIRAAYDEAWGLYKNLVEDTPNIDHDWVGTLLWSKRYSIVVSTIPLPALCDGRHQFRSRDIWAVGDAPERDIFSPVRVHRDTVLCNGLKEPAWYRASNIFGYQSTEWPGDVKPPWNVAKVAKPLDTNCACFDLEVARVGRYGSWTKGALAHDGYYKVKERI